ncbi:Lectizyme, partial [Trachymyrmex cornetzi]
IQRPSVWSDSSSFETRVVGGNEAPKGLYKFILSLQVKSLFSGNQHFCGASILNAQWALTAAHCVYNTYSASKIIVKAGKFDVKRTETTEQIVKLDKFIIHENYKGGVGPYDIALLKLATPLTLNENVQAIALPELNSEPTGQVWLCGWGSTSTTNTPVMPSTLQHVMMTIMNFKSCNQTVIKMTGSAPLDDKSNVCTGPLSSSELNSACSGDSGGPLFKIINGKPILVGIVSWGMIPCGISGAPSVFTKVSSFNPWIQQKMSQ